VRTSLYINATDALVSDKVTLAKPKQETTEVKNRLLDGSWHIQTVGDPAKSFELEFIVTPPRRKQSTPSPRIKPRCAWSATGKTTSE